MTATRNSSGPSARNATAVQRAGVVETLGGRIKRAVRRRAGRFEWMLIAFVVLLPALATGVLAGR